jgi:hypothetical protein
MEFRDEHPPSEDWGIKGAAPAGILMKDGRARQNEMAAGLIRGSLNIEILACYDVLHVNKG